MDKAVSPPAYGVELDDGSVRDTEYFRLRPRVAGDGPPAPVAQGRVLGGWVGLRLIKVSGGVQLNCDLYLCIRCKDCYSLKPRYADEW